MTCDDQWIPRRCGMGDADVNWGREDAHECLCQEGGPFPGVGFVLLVELGEGKKLVVVVSKRVSEVAFFHSATMVHLTTADKAVAVGGTGSVIGMGSEAVWGGAEIDSFGQDGDLQFLGYFPFFEGGC